MIIDCHCHTGRADLIDQSWTNGAPMLAYLRRARAAGISKTVVFSQLRGDYNAGNEEVARIVARFPERLIGFVFVDARRDAGHIFGMVDRAVRKHAFRGIKVHGIDAMPTREVCETARAFRLPVVMDIIGRAVVVEKLAPLYPDVNFIIPHLGSFNDDLGVQQRVVDQLARYENVYTPIPPGCVDLIPSSRQSKGHPRANCFLARTVPGFIQASNCTRSGRSVCRKKKKI